MAKKETRDQAATKAKAEGEITTVTRKPKSYPAVPLTVTRMPFATIPLSISAKLSIVSISVKAEGGITTVTRMPMALAPPPLSRSTKPVTSTAAIVKEVEESARTFLDAKYSPSEYATIDRAAIVSRPSQSLVSVRTGRNIRNPAAPVRVIVVR